MDGSLFPNNKTFGQLFKYGSILLIFGTVFGQYGSCEWKRAEGDARIAIEYVTTKLDSVEQSPQDTVKTVTKKVTIPTPEPKPVKTTPMIDPITGKDVSKLNADEWIAYYKKYGKEKEDKNRNEIR